MFTGIVQHVGRVVGASAVRAGYARTAAARLRIDVGPLAANLAAGASLAVNGVCLTIVETYATMVDLDVVHETWRRSTLSALRAGDDVNLERSLRVGDAIDGHFVQGHVDGVGTVERVDLTGGQWLLWVRVESELLPAIVPKGSIALDGTSLTIVEVAGPCFSVALVPTTLDRTVLRHRAAGDIVNVETDILARLVARRLAWLRATSGAAVDESTKPPWPASSLTLDKLTAAGFAP